MNPKRAKINRKLTHLPSLTPDQQKRFEKLFKQEKKKAKYRSPKNIITLSSKMHKGESYADFRERRRKTNKRKKLKRKEKENG